MPIIITPEEGNSGGGAPLTYALDDKGYKEKYPLGLDLRPGTQVHTKILNNILRLADDSWRVMQNRHASWNKIDEVMTAYIPLSDYEKALKQRGGSGDMFHGENRPVSIVVPYSYATQETILTYMTQAFLRGTVLQYEGVGPEDDVGAKLLEVVIDQQVKKMRAALVIHSAMSNALKYGLAPSTFEWVEQWGFRSMVKELQHYGPSGNVLATSRQRVQEPTLLYEGNKISNIDPYRYLPDPNVSAENIQDGEFVGWTVPQTMYSLLSKEYEDDTLFNVRYLKGEPFTQRSSKYEPDQSSRGVKSGSTPGESGIKTAHTRYTTLLNMYVTLIPKEWNIHPGERPEVWLFTVADDSVIVRMMPRDMNHQQYPIAVAAPDADGFSATPLSRTEMVYGLQEVLNWLFNAHVANVRKAINDMLIVDPSLVVMKDLENPEPGKLVRLRRSAWGRGVKDAVHQLGVADITRQNIGDASFVMDIIQRVSAATDATQGIIRQGGERRSATEYRMTVSNAISRLEHIAQLISLQYMQPLAYFYASHTQQYMTKEIYSKVVGTWPDVLTKVYPMGSRVAIHPEDIAVEYDINPRDGSVPTSGAANADIWTQLFQIVGSSPELQMQFSVTKIFSHIAMLLGAKNLFEFTQNGGNVAAATAPDEDVLEQAAKGNLIPLNAA